MAVKTGTNKKEKINGTVSADTITGLAGSDTLSGAAGNDFIDGGVDNDSLDGGIGNDTLIGGAGKDTLLGGSGNDRLDGGNDNDKLTGDAGADTLNGGVGADTMTGGDGNDYYFVDNLKDSVTETNKVQTTGGNDTIESVLLNYTLPENFENLVLAGIELSNGTGNKANNVITGNLVDNLLKGDAGNDTLIGNEGVDTLDGGLGMDVLKGGDDSDIYFMNNTDDSIVENEGGGDLDQVNATVSFSLSENPNVEALELSGAKAIDGTGNEFNNLIQEKEGGTVANELTGMAGNDTLDGAGGDDTLNGGDGDDSLDGGDGEDTAIYNSLKSDYQIDINVDADNVPQIVIKFIGDPQSSGMDEGTDILSNIEMIEFSNGSTINAADILDGTWEEDSTPEEDTGEEPVDGDFVDEEPVDGDFVDEEPIDGDFVDEEPVIDEPTPAPVKTKPTPTKTVTSSANDKLGSPDDIDSSNVQYGTKGDDKLSGSGNDWVNALAGNDNITGKQGDTLIGGAGDDTLTVASPQTTYVRFIGGSGTDHLVSNGGRHYFIFGEGDTGVGAARDVIDNFNIKADKIDLVGSEVPGTMGFGSSLTLIKSKTIDAAPFTDINQVRFFIDFDNAETIVQINLDDDFSTVEAEIALTGVMKPLDDHNFILR